MHTRYFARAIPHERLPLHLQLLGGGRKRQYWNGWYRVARGQWRPVSFDPDRAEQTMIFQCEDTALENARDAWLRHHRETSEAAEQLELALLPPRSASEEWLLSCLRGVQGGAINLISARVRSPRRYHEWRL
jgi:hypothetical protein